MGMSRCPWKKIARSPRTCQSSPRAPRRAGPRESLQRGETEELLHAVGLDDDVFPSHERDRETPRILDAGRRRIHATHHRTEADRANHDAAYRTKGHAPTRRPDVTMRQAAQLGRIASVADAGRHRRPHGGVRPVSLDPDPTRARGQRTSQQGARIVSRSGVLSSVQLGFADRLICLYARPPEQSALPREVPSARDSGSRTSCGRLLDQPVTHGRTLPSASPAHVETQALRVSAAARAESSIWRECLLAIPVLVRHHAAVFFRPLHSWGIRHGRREGSPCSALSSWMALSPEQSGVVTDADHADTGGNAGVR